MCTSSDDGQVSDGYPLFDAALGWEDPPFDAVLARFDGWHRDRDRTDDRNSIHDYWTRLCGKGVLLESAAPIERVHGSPGVVVRHC